MTNPTRLQVAPQASRTRQPAGVSLRLRTLSALVLAPVAIAAVWFGSPWLPLLVALAAAGMAWEWALLCGAGRLGARGVLLIGAVSFAVLATALHGISVGLASILFGMFFVGMFAWESRRPEIASLALGAVWIALPCMLFLWLAGSDGAGRVTLLWIFAVVWATDIGAYAIGRRLGGPLLAPRWSPRKTWAGLVGGVGCAAFAGGVTALVLGTDKVFTLALLSAGLAIVEQFGDLAESVAKRRFGVKDSSGLIPGHGGLLDRLDGLLAVIPAVALLTVIGGGSSVLSWR